MTAIVRKRTCVSLYVVLLLQQKRISLWLRGLHLIHYQLVLFIHILCFFLYFCFWWILVVIQTFHVLIHYMYESHFQKDKFLIVYWLKTVYSSSANALL